MKLKLVKKKCRGCGNPEMELVDKCIIYDKYYICPKCGLTDFRESKKMTHEESWKRLNKILKSIKKEKTNDRKSRK